MTETTKAPSKEAMEAVRGVRCPHEPVNCDYCVAAALEAFAATVNNHIRLTYESEHADAETFKAERDVAAKNLIELASAHITVTLDRDALRERNRALVEAGQRFVDNDSWCANLTAHDAKQPDCSCGYVGLRAALAADAKAGEDR